MDPTAQTTPDTLKISEIFLSIQGEGTRTGRPCTLVRLAGCAA
jgi:organic radical activating enzyme